MNVSDSYTTDSGKYRLTDDVKLERWSDQYGWTEVVIVPEHCACSVPAAVALYEHMDLI